MWLISDLMFEAFVVGRRICHLLFAIFYLSLTDRANER